MDFFEQIANLLDSWSANVIFMTNRDYQKSLVESQFYYDYVMLEMHK